MSRFWVFQSWHFSCFSVPKRLLMREHTTLSFGAGPAPAAATDKHNLPSSLQPSNAPAFGSASEQPSGLAALTATQIEPRGARAAASPISLRNDKHILVSCLFGSAFNRLYPAIDGRKCIFFSNNETLRGEAESKGWEFRFVAKHSLSPDYRISSQQSKYIKFLQFLGDYTEYAGAQAVTYFDHKFYVKEEHIRWILAHVSPEKSVLIRTTPKLKTRITDEVQAAMGQERYAINMKQTLQWISSVKNTRAVVEDVRIVNTGFIHYSNFDKIRPMLDELYQTVWALGQPECQILWAALSQAYETHIQRVEWEELNPRWVAP